jgi:FtsZ-interacting cell division protein ZipA
LLAIVAIIQLIISIVRLCLIKSAKRKAKKAKQELTTSTDYSDESDSSSIDEGFWSEQSESKANDDAEEAQSESEQQEAYTTAQAEPVEDEQTTMDIAEAQPVQEKQQENETYEAPEALTDSGEQMQIPVEQTNDTVTEETHTIVYNVKRVYNGPTDKFMDTLTESEKIEFVKVFIEKSKGTLPRIPDYEIGGDNAEFFPAVFIYLGKIRGLISAGLLAKIYKQLNLMN